MIIELVQHSSIPSLTILAVLLVAFVFQVVYYVRYLMAPLRFMRRAALTESRSTESECGTSQQLDLFAKPVTGVSVIVCARNEAANLRPYLKSVLEQDFPLFEVIVVNDGSEDATQAVIDEYMVQYHNLRTTFVPVDARVRSSKKLALTLAIKAARYDYLVLTDADCCPQSSKWLSLMMNGFERSESLTNKYGPVQVVLGYGAYFNDSHAINTLIQYDTLFNGLQYMGFAMCGYPYMGVGRNLAYRKSLFLSRQGFSGMLNERSGDDDLFVNHVATAHNTEVVLSRDALTWSVPKTSFSQWIQQKRRHLTVAPLYKASSRLRLGLEPVMRALFYASFILCFVLGSPIMWAIAGGAFLVRLLVQGLTMNLSSSRLGGTWFGLSLIGLDILLPLINAWLLITMHRSDHQRW